MQQCVTASELGLSVCLTKYYFYKVVYSFFSKCFILQRIWEGLCSAHCVQCIRPSIPNWAKAIDRNSKNIFIYLFVTSTDVFHINPSCYVPELICRSYKFNYKQHTVRQDATGNTKMRGEEIQHVYKESEGQQMYAGGVSDHTAIQPYRLFRQQKGFVRSSVNHSNPEEWGWVAQKQASAAIYCSNAPDSVIILLSVPQITLGPVPLSCIRFTTLYIHLLSRVNNDSTLGNWINCTEIGK